MVCVGLILQLAAGVFDLSVGAMVGSGSMPVASRLAEQGMSRLTPIILTLLCGAFAGAASGGLVVFARIDSFIAALAMKSVRLAAAGCRTKQIMNVPSKFISSAPG